MSNKSIAALVLLASAHTCSAAVADDLYIDSQAAENIISTHGSTEEHIVAPDKGGHDIGGQSADAPASYGSSGSAPERSTAWASVTFCPASSSNAPEVYFHVWTSCSPRPTKTAAPDGPAPEAGASRPVTVTRSQVSRLLVGGSGITRQPPSASTRLGMPVIVYTSPAPQTLTTTVLGTPVTITATPRTYTWSWADGTTTRTTTPFNVKAYTAVLTDDAEHAQGH